ncbi:NAD(P)-dependent oxidoreductase [Spiractinospora alimapuensis]|uniref:NAD(P)-dependent oxidoreductase n=1 Tax=Spiractinospora alimapuensis TaxID=2820884 RepID=UPI001F2B3DF2|nr:NAD(P)-binding domain-containing protein [Spiractinospora alimapuensis]QVQ50033.1 NAD(P)-dependent oxidoreductase [Spiractinospora alimapuensis]
MTDKTPVTVLGLGPMGSALAGTFVDAGHPTTVWNRTASKAEPLVEKGARHARSAAEAVAASELVVVNVMNYAAVRAIVEPIAADLRGRTLVNLTADLTDRARDMAEWAAGHGINYIDGAIMTPTESIGGPGAVFIYSGDEELYQRWRPSLASLGGTHSHLGSDHGRAAAYDAALLDFFWTSMNGLMHAFALARAEGVSATELTPFAQGIGQLTVDLAPDLASRADGGNFPGEGSLIESNADSMGHLIEASEARGIDASVLRAAKAIADKAVAEGHGKEDYARVVEMYERGAF